MGRSRPGVRTQGSGGGGRAHAIDDAPVLAAADASVAIAGGTDLAKMAADIVLLGEARAGLVCAVETARRMQRIIRQNLAWAVLYNLTAVPLAAGGWLEPWMAALGMSLSSLIVVLNTRRLLRVRGAPPAAPAPTAAPRGAIHLVPSAGRDMAR